MHRLTSEIITSMAAASGSRTNPSRRVCSPNVNHVKFWTDRKPCICSVGRNATIEIASAAISPSLKSRPLRQMAPPATARDYSRSLDSSFELVVLIDVRCSEMPINGNDHRESNSGLGCGDGDGKDGDHHPGW